MPHPFVNQFASVLRDAGIEPTQHELEFLNNSHEHHQDSFFLVAINLFSSRLLERTLQEHAKAIIQSAEASERYNAALVESAKISAGHTAALVEATRAQEHHAAGLTRATWVLAFVTFMLAVATAVLVYFTYLGQQLSSK